LPNRVLIYTHPECTYSAALKDDLNTAGTKYEEVDLALHPEAWAEVEQFTGGDRITPVMLEDGKVTVGYYGVG